MRPRQLLALLGLLGACKGAGSTVDSKEAGPVIPGGTTNIDLDLGIGGESGAGGQGGREAPSTSDCESFAELDQCGVTSVEATFSASNVLLVIDKSSSMDDQPNGFEVKKWEALKAALGPALSAAQDEMSFGLLLYPFGEQAEIPLDCFEGCCEVPSACHHPAR